MPMMFKKAEGRATKKNVECSFSAVGSKALCPRSALGQLLHGRGKAQEIRVPNSPERMQQKHYVK